MQSRITVMVHLWSRSDSLAPGESARLQECGPTQVGTFAHHWPGHQSEGDTREKSLLWAHLLFRGWKTPHSFSSEAGLIDWSHMNLKAVKSEEDEKQFKLLYYHFLVKYQFSPQPYCEAAGFQISTVLACAPRREEMPGSEKQKHLFRSPEGLLLEP